MEDIEAVIEASKHFKYHEPTGMTPFNRVSSLPESKKHLKLAIQGRMRLLAASYISLASFIDDDIVDFLEADWESESKGNKRKVKKIFEKVLRDMEKLKNEIKKFDPTEA